MVQILPHPLKINNMRMFFVWYGSAILCTIYAISSIILIVEFIHILYNPLNFDILFFYYILFVRLYKILLNFIVPIKDRLKYLGIVGA